MVSLRNVVANGLGLLISWGLLVVLQMACRSSMVGCFATSTKTMHSDSAMVVLHTYRMVTLDGETGLVMVTMVQ